MNRLPKYITYITSPGLSLFFFLLYKFVFKFKWFKMRIFTQSIQEKEEGKENWDFKIRTMV